MDEMGGIIRIYRILVVDNLFISLLFIKLFSRFFSKDAYTVSKQIIRWLIIVCAAVSLLDWALYMLTNNPAVSERAFGPYWWSFWIIVLVSDILPLVLLFPKLKNKGWAIFIVALLINTGWLMELLVIIMTSLHRDYLPSTWTMIGPFGLISPLFSVLIYGFLLAIFITGISIIVMKFREKENDIVKPLL